MESELRFGDTLKTQFSALRLQVVGFIEIWDPAEIFLRAWS